MKIVFLIIALGLLYLSNAEGQECPLMGVDILFHDIDSKADVEDWEACGKFCQSTDGCKFWTYNTKTLLCFVKDQNTYSEHNDIAISGDSNCP